MDPDVAAELQGGAFAAPGTAPRIVQLSPVPGNIYETDRFYYDPVAVYSAGPFGAILAFAAAHGHPAVVHDCPDLHKFQVVRSWRLLLPSSLGGLLFWLKLPQLPLRYGSITLAAPAVAPVDVRTPSVRSSPLLSHESLSRGGDPPPDEAVSLAAVTARGSFNGWPAPLVQVRSPAGPVSQILPRTVLVHGPPRPDPDGATEPPLLVGGRHHPIAFGSSPLYGGFPAFHGGPAIRQFSFPSSGSTADLWRLYAFPGGLPPDVPPYIQGPPVSGVSRHAPASVASTLASTAPTMRPLAYEDHSGSTGASDLTMSFWPVVNPSVVPVVGAPPAGSVLSHAAAVGPHGTTLPVHSLPAGTAAPPVVPAVSGATPLPVADLPALPISMGGPVPAPRWWVS